MKKYLKVTVISKSGMISQNPLMISESNLIPPLASNNKSLIIKEVEVELDEYKRIFGKI